MIEMQVNEHFRPMFTEKVRTVINKGGAGSSKSFTTAQALLLKVMSYHYCKVIVCRKHANTLKDSCYSLLRSLIFRYGLEADFDFTVSPLRIVHKPTKNEFLFRGIDDPEKIKSIVDPTDAWLEEASEFDREDYTQLNLRVRGDNNTPKQLWISFNPIDEDHWLKETFFDNVKDSCLIIDSNYLHNRFIDEEYKQELERLKDEDANMYNIYALGKWGTFNKRGNIYKSFDEVKNIANYKYNPDLPLIVCMDFNVDPMKWALIQHVSGNDYVFDEIVQQDTTTERMTAELVRRYGKANYQVYGDYSGTFRHTSSPSTDYDVVRQQIPNARFFYKPNPLVVDRINAMNNRLCNQQDVRRLFFTNNCVNAIADMKRVKFVEGKREEDKSQEKYDGRNPVNALVHISSAIGYYIEYNYGLRGKAKVITNMF